MNSSSRLTHSLGGEFDSGVAVGSEHLHFDKGAGGAPSGARQVPSRHHPHPHRQQFSATARRRRVVVGSEHLVWSQHVAAAAVQPEPALIQLHRLVCPTIIILFNKNKLLKIYIYCEALFDVCQPSNSEARSSNRWC